MSQSLKERLNHLYFHSSDRRVIGELIDAVIGLADDLAHHKDLALQHKQQTEAHIQRLERQIERLKGTHGA